MNYYANYVLMGMPNIKHRGECLVVGYIAVCGAG